MTTTSTDEDRNMTTTVLDAPPAATTAPAPVRVPNPRWRPLSLVALLVGTALTVLPATWTVLEYRQAREYLDRELEVLAAPRSAPTAPTPGQPDSKAHLPANPADRKWSLSLVLKGPSRRRPQ